MAHTRIGIGVFVLLTVASCAAKNVTWVSPNQTAALTGMLTYLERIALPSDSVVEVWIADGSEDALSVPVLAETAFLTDGRQVPIPFELHYDPTRIDPSRTYAIRAVIRNNGEILYSSAMPTPVLTQGNPLQVELVLTKPASGFGR